MRYSSLLYWSLLTIALCARQPLALLRGNGSLTGVYTHIQPLVHFLSFALLTVWVMCGRWPIPRRFMLGVVAGYAILTEVIQLFIPSRTAEWPDLAQNFAGIAVGLCVWWALDRMLSLLLSPSKIDPAAS